MWKGLDTLLYDNIQEKYPSILGQVVLSWKWIGRTSEKSNKKRELSDSLTTWKDLGIGSAISCGDEISNYRLPWPSCQLRISKSA